MQQNHRQRPVRRSVRPEGQTGGGPPQERGSGPQQQSAGPRDGGAEPRRAGGPQEPEGGQVHRAQDPRADTGEGYPPDLYGEAAARVLTALHAAKQELAEELEANLKQLKTVLEETQRIQRQMEAVLKEARAEAGLWQKAAGRGQPLEQRLEGEPRQANAQQAGQERARQGQGRLREQGRRQENQGHPGQAGQTAGERMPQWKPDAGPADGRHPQPGEPPRWQPPDVSGASEQSPRPWQPPELH